jgi:hypothetical protein
MDNSTSGNIVQKVNLIQDKKKQAYGFGAFTVFVILVLVIGAIQPSVTTILSLLNEIEEKEQLIIELDTKITNLGKLDTQSKELAGPIRDLELLFPNTGDFSFFMANIEGVVETNGFDLNSIGFTEINDDFVTNAIVLQGSLVSLSVKGDLDNIVQLLTTLEEMPMSPIIQSVSYTTDADKDENYTVSIQMVIYHIEDINFYN